MLKDEKDQDHSLIFKIFISDGRLTRSKKYAQITTETRKTVMVLISKQF
jgi:hypothetical protein